MLWNFGPGAPLPRWKINTDDPTDLGARIRMDQIAQQMGLAITEHYMRQTYGFPEPAAGDEALIPRAAAAPAAMDPAGDPGQQFSDARMTKDVKDLRRLMLQLRAEAFDAYRDRIEQIAEEVMLNHGGLR